MFHVQGRNVLRAWEDKPEAARYALMLRAEELPLGKPTELSLPVSVSYPCYYNLARISVSSESHSLQLAQPDGDG